jgi:hypothetical protein
VVFLLDRLHFCLLRLLTIWATGGVVAWLITAVAYKLFSRLTDRGFVPWPIPVSVIPGAVVPVILVLTVPFGADTGVLWTRKRARPSGGIRKASLLI